MAYSAPELLLVGAAQNLVLETSEDFNTVGPCQFWEREDNDVTYDGGGLW